MKVEKWIPYDKTVHALPDNDIGGFGGWFEEGHRWKDYIKMFNDSSCEYVEALRTDILERKIRNGGNWHQSTNAKGVPVFSDGTVATYSMRAWGDLMAAIYSEIEDVDYSYCDFAWEC